jgi:hypothetical protein
MAISFGFLLDGSNRSCQTFYIRNLLVNSTQNTSDRAFCDDLEREPLAGRIQAWFFNLHTTLADTALHCSSSSVQTSHILASTDLTIPYTLEYSKFLFHAKFVKIHLKYLKICFYLYL